MKLNNKGFAISGILYTVFVIFLLILLYVLGGLNSKRKLLEKNIESIEQSMYDICYTIGTSNTQLSIDPASIDKAQYTGKYTFNNGCVTFAKEGDNLVGKSCIGGKTVTESDTIKEICTTEQEVLEQE